MRLKNCLFYVLILFVTPTWAQLRDTILHSMSSRPFYYNVLKAGDGKIYAGTSDGVYILKKEAIQKIDNRVGYLTLDKKGSPIIDSNGIKYHEQSKYVRLLPYNTEIRDEYHAGMEDFFYITSAGKMHIYEILPYDLRYRNHSVRTASKNFVGTYSGIYYKGRKIESSEIVFPSFTDGHIRELNGKVFVCYSSLHIAKLHQGDSLPTHIPDLPEGFSFDWVTDILYSEYFKQYFVATKTDFVSMDSALTKAKSIYKSKENNAEIILLGKNKSSVFFASGRDLMTFNPHINKVKLIITMPEPILDGHISNLSYYLLGSQGLYVTRADGGLKKLDNLNKAHTLLSLGASDFAISTDAGLFQYNEVSNKLSALIQGVEFNRRGLYLEGDSLFAGSINGLYVLDAKHLEQLTDRITKVSNTQTLPGYVLALLIGMAMLVAWLINLLYHSRRRLSHIIEETRISSSPKVTRDDIETFIIENLAQASLKSVSEKFKINTAIIYMLIAPEKPGAFINRLRMEQVKRLRKDGKTAKLISELTGFSEYYVRKVWNTKE